MFFVEEIITEPLLTAPCTICFFQILSMATFKNLFTDISIFCNLEIVVLQYNPTVFALSVKRGQKATLRLIICVYAFHTTISDQATH